MKPPPLPDDDDALEAALRRSASLQDAPEALIQRAIDLFATRARPVAAPASPVTALRRLQATLSFDSRGAAGLAFGLRSGAAATRQLLYSADGRDVDLRVSAAGAGAAATWRITGQVLGPDAAGTAELRGSDGAVQGLARWSDLAEFAFDPVGAGQWTVVLQGDDWELELPPLDLSAGG